MLVTYMQKFFRLVSSEQPNKMIKLGAVVLVSTYAVNVRSKKLTTFSGEFMAMIDANIKAAVKECELYIF